MQQDAKKEVQIALHSLFAAFAILKFGPKSVIVKASHFNFKSV